MRFPLSLVRLALTTKSSPTPTSFLLFSRSRSRPLSTSPQLLVAPKLPSSAGSGKGGRKEKDQAKKDKEALQKQKDQDRKERDKLKLREQRDKDKKLRDKERERKIKEKEKLQKAKLKEKEKAKLLKDKKPKAAPRTRSLLHAPRAPANAWGVYLAQFIQERKEALPASAKLPSVTILTSEAAPLYKALSPSEKAPLVEEAQRQRAEYPAILEAWKRSLTPEMIREENAIRSRRRKMGLSKRKGLKLEGEPKKPLTGYMRFASEVRQDLYGGVLRGETDILEQSKRIAEAWKLLTEEERETYNKQYAAAKEEYQKEKQAFDEAQAARV